MRHPVRFSMLRLTDSAPAIVADGECLFAAQGVELTVWVEPSRATITDKPCLGRLMCPTGKVRCPWLTTGCSIHKMASQRNSICRRWLSRYRFWAPIHAISATSCRAWGLRDVAPVSFIPLASRGLKNHGAFNQDEERLSRHVMKCRRPLLYQTIANTIADRADRRPAAAVGGVVGLGTLGMLGTGPTVGNAIR